MCFQLEVALGEDAPMPEFPPRTLTSFGNFDPEFVEKRRRLLERFFLSLAPYAWTKSCLREFLGVDDAEVAKNVPSKPHLIWPFSRNSYLFLCVGSRDCESDRIVGPNLITVYTK